MPVALAQPDKLSISGGRHHIVSRFACRVDFLSRIVLSQFYGLQNALTRLG